MNTVKQWRSGQLHLNHEPGGYRHYLCGRAVHCGTPLKLLVDRSNDTWIWARYECNLTRDDCTPILFTEQGRLIPDRNAELRWPEDWER